MPDGLHQYIHQILTHDGYVPLRPLLMHTLRSTGREVLLEKTPENKLKEQRLSIATRNAFFFKELRQILHAFQSRGLDCIVLKGAALDALYYPPGLRCFGDMDILIRREECTEVFNVLTSLGFQVQHGLCHDGADEFQHEVKYEKRGKVTVAVEPHWMLAPPFSMAGSVDMDGIWKRAQSFKIADVEMKILCPEDFLIHLCLHLFLHHKGGWLTSCCDIVELVSTKQEIFQWRDFLDRVLQWKLCLPVQYSLQKALDLFQPPIPSFVMEGLGSYIPNEKEHQAFALQIGMEQEKSGASAHALLPLLTMPRLSMKLRYLMAKVFPSREFMVTRYEIKKNRLLPLYYLLRWKDILLFGLKTLRGNTNGRG